jgi:hypothetical protein
MLFESKDGVPPPKFISALRFGEAMDEATQLKKGPERLGAPTFLCDIPEGEDIEQSIAEAIDKCEMVAATVVMGTLTYGKRTSSNFSALELLKLIVDEEKPMFLVNMSPKFY